MSACVAGFVSVVATALFLLFLVLIISLIALADIRSSSPSTQPFVVLRRRSLLVRPTEPTSSSEQEGEAGENMLRFGFRCIPLFRASFLLVEGKFLCLSELGSLVWVDMDERGWKVISKKQLFFAPGTWTLPALHGGLLYVMQNETDRQSKSGPRLICYDVRK